MNARDLGLQGNALKAALEVERVWPNVVFTSGRRSLAAQAIAMARNVCLDRNFIRDTYVHTPIRDDLQALVDKYQGPLLVAPLAGVLEAALRGYGEYELALISKHLSSEAFDCDPDSEQGIVDTLERLAKKYGGKLLKREGKLKRLHWQV